MTVSLSNWMLRVHKRLFHRYGFTRSCILRTDLRSRYPYALDFGMHVRSCEVDAGEGCKNWKSPAEGWNKRAAYALAPACHWSFSGQAAGKAGTSFGSDWILQPGRPCEHNEREAMTFSGATRRVNSTRLRIRSTVCLECGSSFGRNPDQPPQLALWCEADYDDDGTVAPSATLL